MEARLERSPVVDRPCARQPGPIPFIARHLAHLHRRAGLPSVLKRHDWPQLLCLQEVKINAQDRATQRAVQQAANHAAVSEEPTYVAHFSLPTDRFNARGFGGKVYWVATLIHEDVASQVDATRQPPWDREGRVLIHDLAARVTVINGYWVNGTTNPYRDPATGETTGTRHDHKLRFHRHMLAEVLRCQGDGHRVVLVGDMNVARARIDGHPNMRTSPVQHVRNRADFNAKFFSDDRGMQGVDIFRHVHGDTRKFTYHPRGRRWGESCVRVDLIVVSPTLVHACLDTDICDSAQERGHSDHVPLWVAVDLSKLSPPADGAEQVSVSPATTASPNATPLLSPKIE